MRDLFERPADVRQLHPWLSRTSGKRVSYHCLPFLRALAWLHFSALPLSAYSAGQGPACGCRRFEAGRESRGCSAGGAELRHFAANPLAVLSSLHRPPVVPPLTAQCAEPAARAIRLPGHSRRLTRNPTPLSRALRDPLHRIPYASPLRPHIHTTHGPSQADEPEDLMGHDQSRAQQETSRIYDVSVPATPPSPQEALPPRVPRACCLPLCGRSCGLLQRIRSRLFRPLSQQQRWRCPRD